MRAEFTTSGPITARGHGPPHMAELRSARAIQAILWRERARADRTGVGFSLLLFGGHDHNGTLDALTEALCRRVRATDDAGWYAQKQLCAVLPDTAARGAWRLADDVCAPLGMVAADCCEVYTYPANWTGNDRPGHEGDRRHSHPSPGESRLGEGASGQPMETLFISPLPLWKRIVDVVGVFVAMLLLWPLMAVIALAIKLTSDGPVMFVQRRAGLGGRCFNMYKFRTMVPDAEARQQELRALSEQDGPAFKLSADPRVTRIGRFLRCTSLDELPQLWNVLLGDMSLVGPRPLPCAETDACESWHRRRLDVTPGLTCLWQVHGRSRVAFDDWMRMDIAYIRGRRLSYDMQILLLTIPAVVMRRGAH